MSSKFTGRSSRPGPAICLPAYLEWVNAWLGSEKLATSTQDIVLGETAAKVIHGDADMQLLHDTAAKIQNDAKFRTISIGNAAPPSCDDNNVLLSNFDPRVDCACKGLSPTESNISSVDARAYSAGGCRAIDRMWQSAEKVMERSQEWDGHGIFTMETLREAVQELTLINTSMRPPAKTCYSKSINKVTAPDRRRCTQVDSPNAVYMYEFPTFEGVKLCSDAKHFFSIACGISVCDEGISRAVSDAANDILIGDYAEAADQHTLEILQRTGAAAFAFLELCYIAGYLEGWHLDVLVACTVQFRVLSYYRDHTRPSLPDTVFGSRMSRLESHRMIDIGIAPPIIVASLVSAQKIDAQQYRDLCRTSVLLNDLIDIRSDAARKQRKNPVLRGMSQNMCEYLGGQMRECISSVARMVETGMLTALVTLGFCNWMLMASHHKVHENIVGVEEFASIGCCDYGGREEYRKLLTVLEPLGTSTDVAPDVRMTRANLEQLYCRSRLSSETHLAWLADAARTLLNPYNMRRMVDIGHFRWVGNVGDVEYCP
ncbi:hypothetical protein JX266_008862 [Neoarthrinium moseri]|nr:hypothetical protein JX266_008862 [Neoarthrinium moseri]